MRPGCGGFLIGYQYRPARRLEKIEADIQQVEKEIMAMLPDVAG